MLNPGAKVELPPFRFVLVGAGNISRTYVRAIRYLEGIHLAALVSRGGQRPPHLPFTIPVFPTLDAVNIAYEAVILATPNALHHQGTIQAARLGKHVLTEKPLDVSLAHMDAMCAACAEAGVTLGVCYQRRLSPDNVAIKKLLDSSQLGRVFAADLRVKFHRDEHYYRSGHGRGSQEFDGGGVFMQQASHSVDLLCWFFGRPAKVTSMLGTFLHPIESEDHGVALLRYPNGLIASITASTATKPGFPPVLELHSDKGTVILENDCIKTWAIDGLPNPGQTSPPQGQTSFNTAAVTDTAGHEAILRDFAAAVREHREPAVPAASARLATEVILQIYQAQS